MSIASTVNGVNGQGEICKRWHSYFNDLLNSSTDISHKQCVLREVESISHFDNINRFTPNDVHNALNDLKCGKSPGLDNLYAEHFKYASDELCILIAMALNAMVIHGYFPDELMYTVIIPLVKNKKGDITDMDNYRPIAITTVFSKVVRDCYADISFCFTCS